jgi:hypothetical protein
VLDLGIARESESLYIRQWKYLYIGDITGDVKIRFGGMGWVNPDEFEKLTDVTHYHYLYITNTAQVGKELVIYFEEEIKWNPLGNLFQKVRF